MASRNPDAAENSTPSGEFMPRKPRDEPLQTGGHKPGVQVGNDAKPEFHLETLPAGTAPPDKTFQPQNDSEVQPGTTHSASETIQGATSGDVHNKSQA